ncbi:MAG: helix-turn-helix domain-containing protein, partial [Gaiellaceae bacterium]
MPAGIGVTLREARIRAGVQLSDVQTQTGVKAKYLRALEWERFDLLPNSQYTRRVLQAHARVLQLDPDAMIAELERTIATLPRHG